MTSNALLALLTDPGDRRLIARLKRREEKAAGELSRRFGAVLFSLVLNIAGDACAAEDLLTEIFLKALNLVQTLPEGDFALGLWMLGLARNHAVHFMSGKEAGPGMQETAGPLEAPALFANGGCGPSDLPALERMRSVFLNAGENERLALELAWFEGASFEQIAGKLGPGAVRVRLAVEAVLSEIRAADSGS